CVCTPAWATCTSKTGCIHVEGIKPLISAMVQPMASLYSLRTEINLFSCFGVSLLDMITGSVSPSPRKAYFKSSGGVLTQLLGVVCLTVVDALSETRCVISGVPN